jgi:hypothetical protein
MAISVDVHKEITSYKPKFMFGLTIRQLGFLSIAIALSIGSFFLLTKKLGMSINAASYVVILETMPLMACGFITRNNMPFEQYFFLYMRHRLGVNELPYKEKRTADIPDTQKQHLNTERNAKHVWSFTKGKTKENSSKTAKIIESNRYTTTKEGIKRKRKEVLISIKRAEQEFREAKRAAKKGA